MAEVPVVNFLRPCPECGAAMHMCSRCEYDGDRHLTEYMRCSACNATWTELYRYAGRRNVQPARE
jgi:hypothetical protein